MRSAASFVIAALVLLSAALVIGAWLAVAFTEFRLLTGWPS